MPCRSPLSEFYARFGRAPHERASAPGRVNLIGEHIDYNGGHVLPIALPQRTYVEIALRTDRQVRAYSTNIPDAEATIIYERGCEARGRGWADYIQALTHVLDQEGHPVPGFDIYVRSDVPVGAGLSSSAALEIAVLRVLRNACSLPLDDAELARVAHRSETEFVGAPVGIMDQMASSLATDHAALLIDTRTRQFTRLPLPPAVELALVDSGVTHNHASGEYRVRRAECERAAALLGVPLLCDIPIADIARTQQLPSPLDRRARHVITEQARVLSAVDAIRISDVEQLGRLFLESHASMQHDYEVSVGAVDELVSIAAETPGGLGARMTGGGFGGAVLILCREGRARDVATQALDNYRRTGHPDGSIILPVSSSAGHAS